MARNPFILRRRRMRETKFPMVILLFLLLFLWPMSYLRIVHETTIIQINSEPSVQPMKSRPSFLLEINESLCAIHPMDRNFSRPETEFQIIYSTAKFRVGNAHWTHDLERSGCYALHSKVFRAEDIWVFAEEFSPSIVNHPAYHRHLQFLKNHSDDSCRGAGYWFWKPLIMLEILQSERVAWNTFVVYADADRTGIPSYVSPVIEAMATRGHNFAIQQWRGGPESAWTKGDMLEYFGVYNNSDVLKSPQLQANFYIVQKNPFTIEFFRRWAFLMEKYHLVSDQPSMTPNHVGFVEHRHDQSMLGLLLMVEYKNGWGTKSELDIDLDQIYPSSESMYNRQSRLYTYNLAHVS